MGSEYISAIHEHLLKTAAQIQAWIYIFFKPGQIVQ